MNVKTLVVPKGIRYISQWEGFSLPEFPNIIDKQIPGCGFTEWCLTNNQNTILVSPRKILIKNKKDQHRGEVYLVQSILPELCVDLDFADTRTSENPNSNKAKTKKEELSEEYKTAIRRNYERIKEEVIGYYLTRSVVGLPSKILVTYDSYGKVREALTELGVFDQFYTVVDEFQSIFVDSRFKSETEIEFLNFLKDVNRLCYVSATPMLMNYLDELDEFKDLPYFQLDWESDDKSRIAKPHIDIRFLKTVQGDALKIIESYKSGNFKTTIRLNGDGKPETIQSKEAVFYVNSVNNIINIIYNAGLTPSEVNILCADTPENLKKIQKKLGREFTIGSVPLRDEPRKMFTLCTRTVYLGADFYSDNARTFIFSDANVDSMSVDITLDLPQILGRQRLEENPWKNKAVIYVRVRTKDSESLEKFKAMIDEKLELTKQLLENFEMAPNKEAAIKMHEERAEDRKYGSDYVSINKKGGSNKFPVMNKLVMIAEKRAYDVQQVEYADRFSVFSSIMNNFEILDSGVTEEIKRFKDKFQSAKTAYEKMSILCTEEISEGALSSILDLVPEYMKKFYLLLGPSKCKSLGYNYTKMTREISNLNVSTGSVSDKIYQEFSVGSKVPKAEAKTRLAKLYKDIGYNKTAKATDLEEWFEVRRARIKDSASGKTVDCFELLKSKNK